MSAEDQRTKNREELTDLVERAGRVRDKLATVAAEAGPLFREAVDIVEGLDGILSRSTPPPEPQDPPPADRRVEEPEFAGD